MAPSTPDRPRDETRKSSRLGAPSASAIAASTEAAEPNGAEIEEMGNRVLTVIFDAVDSRDETQLAEPFLRLPSKRQYPEYYVTIRRPVSLAEIKTRLGKHEYETWTDFRHDLETMCNNAKRFNMTDSEIWLKARDLHTIIKEQCLGVYDEWKGRVRDDIASGKRQQTANQSALGKRSRAETPDPAPSRPHKVTLRPSRARDTKRAEKPSPEAHRTPMRSRSDAKDVVEAPEASPEQATPQPAAQPATQPAAPAQLAATTAPATSAAPASVAPSIPPTVSAAPLMATSSPLAAIQALRTPGANPLKVGSPHTPVLTASATNVSPATYEVRRRGAPRGKRIKVMFRWAVNALVTYADRTGHVHAEMFMQLPSPRDYPDYYQFIRHPISFAEIEAKLDQKEYINTYALVSDVRLMLDNAQFYNEEHSLVWNDAQALRIYLDNTVIPAFLAEGFTLDPNDHRQAALPPGTPGYVPPPGGISLNTAPLRQQSPVGVAPPPPPVSLTPAPLQPPAAPVVPEPVVSTAQVHPPHPVPGVPLERVVRALEARAWPPHPALLKSTPDEKPTEERTAGPCPIERIEIDVLQPAGGRAAHVAFTLDTPRVALCLPRGASGAAFRLVPCAGTAPTLHATFDRAPLPGTWLDGTYATQIAPGIGSSALDIQWTLPDGASGNVGLYIRR